MKKAGLALGDFDYELPKELIAPYPILQRSEARLLVIHRKSRLIEHRIFKDLAAYLGPGDFLVLNNTKVLPARLFGKKPTGGRVEVLLLKEEEGGTWQILLRPGGRVRKGTLLAFGTNGAALAGEVLDDAAPGSGVRKIRFEKENLREKLSQIGRVPLPPYIDRPDEAIDRELYQTVFAEKEGAVASPTAGLHFDQELLGALEKKGVGTAFVTLHVSYGTFQPVEAEDLSKHQMYEEEFEVTPEAAQKIRRALKEGRRIVACGTTVARVLETVGAGSGSSLQPTRGKTSLFIYPPYEFKMVHALITNFHLPRTTLLMLVSAFAGREEILQAYAEAVRRRYRFYSYGDAMLIL
jgi:S-adenosylmethionine:tRNA ribosyltransferase-isomerase